jgi:PAS domain S-box-containing protein
MWYNPKNALWGDRRSSRVPKLIVVDRSLNRRREITKRFLAGAEDFEVKSYATLAAAGSAVRDGKADCLLCSINAGKGSPLPLLEIIDNLEGHPPVILISDTQTVDSATAKGLARRAFTHWAWEESETAWLRLINLIRTAIKNVKTSNLSSIELLQPLINALDDQVVLIDQQGKVAAVNHKWLDEWRDSAGDGDQAGIGRDYLEMCDFLRSESSERLKEVGAAIREILAGRRPSFSVLYPCADDLGKPRLFEANYKRVLLSGKPFIMASHTEVTESIDTSLGLVESKELLAAIFNSSLHGILAFRSIRDSSGTVEDFEFTMGNALAERILGITEEQLLNRRVLDVLPRTEEIGLFQMAVEVAETGRSVRTEQRFKGQRMDGWFNISIARFGDGVIVSLSDITELKRSEQERLENAARLRAILDNTEEILYTLDAEGRYTYVSPAISRILGHRVSDLIGKSISDFTHPEDIQERLESIERVLSTGVPVRGIQYRLRHFDGSWRWFAATVSISRGESRNQAEFIGVSYDITEKMRIERELEHYRFLLERIAEQRKREFDAIREKLHREVAERLNVIEKERAEIAREVHDELGQALTALKYDLSWLNQRCETNGPEFQDRVQTALASIEDSIKSVKRISTRLRPAVLGDLGLGAAIEWYAGDFQRRTGIDVVLNLPQEDFEIDADRATALFRVLQESLTNVARHSQAGSVYVVLSAGKGLVSLSVSDDGIGYVPEDVVGARSFGITGMRERVEYFGGKFEIRGRPGEGTKVWVAVPSNQRSVDRI